MKRSWHSKESRLNLNKEARPRPAPQSFTFSLSRFDSSTQIQFSLPVFFYFELKVKWAEFRRCGRFKGLERVRWNNDWKWFSNWELMGVDSSHSVKMEAWGWILMLRRTRTRVQATPVEHLGNIWWWTGWKWMVLFPHHSHLLSRDSSPSIHSFSPMGQRTQFYKKDFVPSHWKIWRVWETREWFGSKFCGMLSGEVIACVVVIYFVGAGRILV